MNGAAMSKGEVHKGSFWKEDMENPRPNGGDIYFIGKSNYKVLHADSLETGALACKGFQGG